MKDMMVAPKHADLEQIRMCAPRISTVSPEGVGQHMKTISKSNVASEEEGMVDEKP